MDIPIRAVPVPLTSAAAAEACPAALYLLTIGIRGPYPPAEIGDVFDVLVLRLRGVSQASIADQLTTATNRVWTRDHVRCRLERTAAVFATALQEGAA